MFIFSPLIDELTKKLKRLGGPSRTLSKCAVYAHNLLVQHSAEDTIVIGIGLPCHAMTWPVKNHSAPSAGVGKMLGLSILPAQHYLWVDGTDVKRCVLFPKGECVG